MGGAELNEAAAASERFSALFFFLFLLLPFSSTCITSASASSEAAAAEELTQDQGECFHFHTLLFGGSLTAEAGIQKRSSSGEQEGWGGGGQHFTCASFPPQTHIRRAGGGDRRGDARGPVRRGRPGAAARQPELHEELQAEASDGSVANLRLKRINSAHTRALL